MAGRPRGEKRRARSVMATDSEWQRIGAGAAAYGLSISDHVVRTLLAPPSPPSDNTGTALTARVQWRVARAVLALESIERLRLDEADMGTAWQEIAAEVDGWIDGAAELE